MHAQRYTLGNQIIHDHCILYIFKSFYQLPTVPFLLISSLTSLNTYISRTEDILSILLWDSEMWGGGRNRKRGYIYSDVFLKKNTTQQQHHCTS